MNCPPLREIMESQAKLIDDHRKLSKALRHSQKKNSAVRLLGYKSVENVWMNFRVITYKDRGWQSLQMRRAIYLYGFSLASIGRRARVAYRTVQYFFHDPKRVGFRSACRIISATKLLMAERILYLEEPFDITWERWHECDPRQIPKTFLKTLTPEQRATLRQKERIRAARTLTSQHGRNSASVTV